MGWSDVWFRAFEWLCSAFESLSGRELGATGSEAHPVNPMWITNTPTTPAILRNLRTAQA